MQDFFFFFWGGGEEYICIVSGQIDAENAVHYVKRSCKNILPRFLNPKYYNKISKKISFHKLKVFVSWWLPHGFRGQIIN